MVSLYSGALCTNEIHIRTDIDTVMTEALDRSILQSHERTCAAHAEVATSPFFPAQVVQGSACLINVDLC